MLTPSGPLVASASNRGSIWWPLSTHSCHNKTPDWGGQSGAGVAMRKLNSHSLRRLRLQKVAENRFIYRLHWRAFPTKRLPSAHCGHKRNDRFRPKAAIPVPPTADTRKALGSRGPAEGFHSFGPQCLMGARPPPYWTTVTTTRRLSASPVSTGCSSPWENSIIRLRATPRSRM